MATNLGRIGINPCGEWVSGTSYTRLDLVYYNNVSYLSKTDSNTAVPTNTTYWSPVADLADLIAAAETATSDANNAAAAANAAAATATAAAAEADTAAAAIDEKIADTDALVIAMGKALLGEGVTIAGQPENVTAGEGVSVTFTVKIYPADATGVTYQWQNKRASASGASWADSSLSGFNTQTITIPVTAARYDYLWRCKVTYDGVTLASRSAQIIAPEE